MIVIIFVIKKGMKCQLKLPDHSATLIGNMFDSPCALKRVARQFFSGKPGFTFCLSCTFIFRNERNCMRKSARVSEELVSMGLPGLQVATRLALHKIRK